MKSLFHPREKLSLFLDRRLSPTEEERLKSHLSECTSCAKLLAKMRAVRQVMAQTPSLRVREDFVGQVLSMHYKQQAEAAFWVGFDMVPQLLPRLALILMLILALLWNLPTARLDSERESVVEESISKASILYEREWISALYTDDQILQFALNGNYESIQGDKK